MLVVNWMASKTSGSFLSMRDSNKMEINIEDMEIMEKTPIPTPFRIGRVNCYIFPENDLTVLDPGPSTEEAYKELTKSLRRIGYSIGEIDRVLISHPHMDHFGLAGRIVDCSGADVFAHKDAVNRLANPIDHFKREQEYFQPFLTSMGLPTDTVDTVLELPDSYTDYYDPVAVTDILADGEMIDVGVDMECISTPGHAPGSLCFLAATEEVVFTGDHVLPDITPNPLLTVTPNSNTRTRSLPTYLESLKKILGIEATMGFGGHGEPILNLEDRARETIIHHKERKESIAKLVLDHEQVTAFQIMKKMFPELPATEMFSGMSEVIGHLDLLEDENRISTIKMNDDLIFYELIE